MIITVKLFTHKYYPALLRVHQSEQDNEEFLIKVLQVVGCFRLLLPELQHQTGIISFRLK